MCGQLQTIYKEPVFLTGLKDFNNYICLFHFYCTKAHSRKDVNHSPTYLRNCDQPHDYMSCPYHH